MTQPSSFGPHLTTILGEPIRWNDLAGFALIVGASFLILPNSRRRVPGADF